MSSPDSSSIVIARLTVIRLVIALLLLFFLSWLQWQNISGLFPAWLALGVYIPLLAAGLIQSRHQSSETALLLHLGIEFQLITSFLYFTGGASNPFISYLLVLLVYSAYNLKKEWVWFIALLGIVDYTLLTQFYQPLNLTSHSHSLAGQSYFDLHLAGMWLTFVLSSLVLAAFIPSLVIAKNRRRQELSELRERQLKNEQLIGIATLAAGTAHEMGTPLMTMEVMLDDACEQDRGLTSADTRLLHQQVNICRQSLQRLALAGRNSQLHNHDVQAYSWLQSLLHRWRLSQPNALWENKGVEHNAIIQQSALLDQAILNLLDNAAQAGNQPIELRTSSDKQHWTLSIRQPDPHAADKLDHTGLFNSSKHNGMGLGLYLSNASIEQFGGQVHLSSETTGATRCIIQLPVIKLEKQRKEAK